MEYMPSDDELEPVQRKHLEPEATFEDELRNLEAHTSPLFLLTSQDPNPWRTKEPVFRFRSSLKNPACTAELQRCKYWKFSGTMASNMAS